MFVAKNHTTQILVQQLISQRQFALTFCDVILILKDGSITYTHKSVLAACSFYFENLIKAHRQTNLELELDVMSASVAIAIIDFFYTGQLNLATFDFNETEICDAIDLLQVKHLKVQEIHCFYQKYIYPLKLAPKIIKNVDKNSSKFLRISQHLNSKSSNHNNIFSEVLVDSGVSKSNSINSDIIDLTANSNNLVSQNNTENHQTDDIFHLNLMPSISASSEVSNTNSSIISSFHSNNVERETDQNKDKQQIQTNWQDNNLCNLQGRSRMPSEELLDSKYYGSYFESSEVTAANERSILNSSDNKSPNVSPLPSFISGNYVEELSSNVPSASIAIAFLTQSDQRKARYKQDSELLNEKAFLACGKKEKDILIKLGLELKDLGASDFKNKFPTSHDNLALLHRPERAIFSKMRRKERSRQGALKYRTEQKMLKENTEKILTMAYIENEKLVSEIKPILEKLKNENCKLNVEWELICENIKAINEAETLLNSEQLFSQENKIKYGKNTSNDDILNQKDQNLDETAQSHKLNASQSKLDQVLFSENEIIPHQQSLCEFNDDFSHYRESTVPNTVTTS